MPEDSVQPVTVLTTNRPVRLGFPIAVIGPPWVVAALRHSSVLAGVDEAVGAVVQLGLSVLALPVPVAVGRICHHSAFHFAGVLLGRLLTTYEGEGGEEECEVVVR